ncbi:hypothetical protein ACHAWF_010392 [Thalassiosira exigua]
MKWRASALGQSGFRVVLNSNLASTVPPSLAPYVYAFSRPYKGLGATVMGMSWARAAIFYGSDRGKEILQSMGVPNTLATGLPPLIVSTGVQFVNMPLVRATITLQNPESTVPNIRESLRLIYNNHGIGGLWHGTSAGILKTVPKYCTAIFVKDYMERTLAPVNPESPTRDKDKLVHSAIKSSAAGVAGAALTNPNEMFKTNLGLFDAVRSLHKELGWNFLKRVMLHKNLIPRRVLEEATKTSKSEGEAKNCFVAMPDKKSNSIRLPPKKVSSRKSVGKTGRRKMVERENAERERINGSIADKVQELIDVLSQGGVSEPCLEELQRALSLKEESDVRTSLAQADSAVDQSWSFASCYPSINVNALVSVLHELRSLLTKAQI